MRDLTPESAERKPPLTLSMLLFLGLIATGLDNTARDM